MAGVLKNMKNAMSYLGMADVSETQDPKTRYQTRKEAEDQDYDPAGTSFDADPTVPSSQTMGPARESDYEPDAEPQARIVTIHPKSYNDAQQIGIAIREGIPVVLNLTDLGDAVAYRIVDFSAGVVFGLRGSIERITPKVFLLSPANISISVADMGKSHDTDLFSD